MYGTYVSYFIFISAAFVFWALSKDIINEKNAEILNKQGKDNMYAIDSDGNLYSPAWFTINLKASYQIIDKLQINAGIENITDQRYRPYSSGICAPGRNFIIALRFKL